MKELNIFKMRTGLGLTQLEFGELLGVDRRTIINYEQGRKIPSSKIKLLELLMENGVVEKKQTTSVPAPILSSNEAMENLQREMVELKDHIKTLKEFIEEKNKLAEMYKNENTYLKDQIGILEMKLGSR